MIDGSTDEQTTITRSEPQKRSMGSSSWYIAGLLFLVAMGFNCYQLGGPSIWFDEAYSVALVRHPLSQVLQIIFGWQPNMELYYLILHFWLGLLGTIGIAPTEFVVRFPSAFFAALSTVVIFAFGKRYINIVAGIIGALLYLLNPHELIYAQEARAYSLQLLLISLGWYFLFAALISKKRWSRAWVGYTLVMSLAIYTQLTSGLMLIVQTIAVAGMLLVPRNRMLIWQRLPALISSMVVVCISILPLVPVVLHGDTTASWLAKPKFSDMLWFLQIITGANRGYFNLAIACILLGAAIVTGSIFWHSSVGQRFLEHRLKSHQILQEMVAPTYSGIVIWGLFCWSFLTIFLYYIVSISVIHVFSERYLVVIIPAFTLLIALGVATLRGRSLFIRVVQGLLALILIVFTFTLSQYFYTHVQVENWRSAATWVEDRYQQHDGLVCYDNNNGCQIDMEYYFQTYPKNGTHFASDTPGATLFWTPSFFSQSDDAISPFVLASYAPKYQRIFYIVGRGIVPPETILWLNTNYSLVSQMSTSDGIVVRLYKVQH